MVVLFFVSFLNECARLFYDLLICMICSRMFTIVHDLFTHFHELTRFFTIFHDFLQFFKICHYFHDSSRFVTNFQFFQDFIRFFAIFKNFQDFSRCFTNFHDFQDCSWFFNICVYHLIVYHLIVREVRLGGTLKNKPDNLFSKKLYNIILY